MAPATTGCAPSDPAPLRGHRRPLSYSGREPAAAANAPLADAGSGLAGEPGDRNVELRIRPPFPLRRLTGE